MELCTKSHATVYCKTVALFQLQKEACRDFTGINISAKSFSFAPQIVMRYISVKLTYPLGITAEGFETAKPFIPCENVVTISCFYNLTISFKDGHKSLKEFTMELAWINLRFCKNHLQCSYLRDEMTSDNDMKYLFILNIGSNEPFALMQLNLD